MTTAYLIALFLLFARYVSRLAPLSGYLPPKWRWLPAALVAAAGKIGEQFPGIDPLPTVPGLEVLLLLALALAPGFLGPEQAPPPKPPSDAGRVLPLLFLALLLVGCSPSREPLTAADAKRAFCSDAGVIAVDESCKAAVYAVPADDRDRVVEACGTLIDVQTAVCE
jgi:anti-sigma factor RsiW